MANKKIQQMASKWTPIGLQMSSNWPPNGLQMASNWPPNGLQMASNWPSLTSYLPGFIACRTDVQLAEPVLQP